MSFIVAKGEKRLRDDRKETVFFRSEVPITSEKIEQFKRRKTTSSTVCASPIPSKN
jgi:hypothetical protein